MTVTASVATATAPDSRRWKGLAVVLVGQLVILVDATIVNVPSIESVNGAYKNECIRGPDQGPWPTVEDVELATLSWVHWWNTQRLHGYLNDVPPTEYEAAYAAQHTDQPLVGIQ